ncbi:MAG TPA: hypothetical protein ACFCUD_10670 [Cyclobacteriaceae bacterium]
MHRWILYTLLLITIQGCDYPENEGLNPQLQNPISPITGIQSIPNSFISGKIEGKVFDAETNEPLTGVNLEYDVYYVRPYDPYQDGFIIAYNQYPLSSGINGRFNFTYNSHSITNKSDTVNLDVFIDATKIGYKKRRFYAEGLIDNRVKRDTIHAPTLSYEIYMEQVN